MDKSDEDYLKAREEYINFLFGKIQTYIKKTEVIDLLKNPWVHSFVSAYRRYKEIEATIKINHMLIDTINKTVSPQNETLGEVITALKVMFPGGEWKEYRVSSQVIVQKEYININPFYVPNYPQPIPLGPYWGTEQWRITCGDQTSPYNGQLTDCIGVVTYTA